MKLYELYEEVVTSEAWKKLDEILCDESLIQEVDSVDLNNLLSISKVLIFEAFGINPKDKGKYFIAGSARLFKNPMLLKVLNEMDDGFELSIGDLDVVVPNQSEWDTLYKNYTTDSEFIKKLGEKIGEKNIPKVVEQFKKQWDKYNGEVYRPGKGGLNLVDKDIESFTSWRPELAKAKGAKDFKVRGTEEILSDAVSIGGYNYMSIYDVLDYKTQLNRDKEKKIVKLIQTFIKGNQNPQEAERLFRNISQVVGK